MVTKIRVLKQLDKDYGPLNNNAKHRFAENHALCIYGNNTVFTFIPKNACSTMRVSIAIENGCIKSTKDLNWIHKNNQTFKADLSELIRAKYTFVILRSPLERLASVYLDKIVDRTAEAWNLYDIIKRTLPLDEITFRKFVDLVTSRQYIDANIHWRPQVDFLIYEKYDDYFAMEDLKNAFPIIEKKSGIKIYDARDITKHGTDQYEKVEDRCYADIPPLEIFNMKQKGFIPSHKSLYDEVLTKKVNDAYAQDVNLYNELFTEKIK